MSFTVVIEFVPDKDLGKLLASLQLPKGVRYELVHHKEVPVEKPNGAPKGPQGIRRADHTLTMTGKKPTEKGPKIAKALDHFERCEVEEGIGGVTVKIFRAYLRRHKQDQALLSRLVHEGYLDYL